MRSATISGRTPSAVDGCERCSSRRGGKLDLGGRARRGADLGERLADLRRRGVLARDEHRSQRGGLCGVEVPLDRTLHGDRLRAGDVEAATAEVIGLASGERDRSGDDERPRDEDQPATTADQAVQADASKSARSLLSSTAVG